jgi:hypothetical protein
MRISSFDWVSHHARRAIHDLNERHDKIPSISTSRLLSLNRREGASTSDIPHQSSDSSHMHVSYNTPLIDHCCQVLDDIDTWTLAGNDIFQRAQY